MGHLKYNGSKHNWNFTNIHFRMKSRILFLIRSHNSLCNIDVKRCTIRQIPQTGFVGHHRRTRTILFPMIRLKINLIPRTKHRGLLYPCFYDYLGQINLIEFDVIFGGFIRRICRVLIFRLKFNGGGFFNNTLYGHSDELIE